ncbi:MAG: PAS domain-containing protein, partial [Trueperaceae bacterium]
MPPHSRRDPFAAPTEAPRQHNRSNGGGAVAASPAWHVAAWLAVVAVASTEAFTRLGFAHGSLYLLPILIASQTRSTRAIVAVAGASAVATLVGLVVAPPAVPGTPSALVIGNRVASVAIVLASAGMLVMLQRSARRRLAAVSEAHQETEDARRRLEVTLSSITDAFFVLGPDWRFRYLNEQAERVLQRRRDDLLGANVWDEFPEAVGSPFQAHYERAARDGVAVAFEAYYSPLETWFEVHVYPSDEGLAVYFQDVTARRRDQERLRLLEAAVERLNDAVVITEAEPRGEEGRPIVYVNPAFERATRAFYFALLR